MRKKLLGKWKKVLAALLAVSLFLSNTGAGGYTVQAETTESQAYTVNIMVEVANSGKITIPQSYITEIKQDNEKIQPDDDGKYTLKAGKDCEYTLKGEELTETVTGKLTTPKDQNSFTIPVNKNKLKLQLSYGDNNLYTGDTKEPDQSLLTHEWVWSSSDSDVVKVDEKTGNITALKAGKAKITKKSSKDSTVSVSADLTVTDKTFPYTLKYRVYGKEKESCYINIDTDKVTVKESKSSQTVAASKDGKYQLKYDTEYICTFNTGNSAVSGVTIQNKGKFRTQKENAEKAEDTIFLDCELNMPRLKIGEISLENEGIEIKRGGDITAVCENYRSLYDTTNWKIAVNGGEKKQLNGENIINTSSEEIIIEYYYGTLKKPVKTQKITTFEKYNFVVKFDNKEITGDYVASFKEKDSGREVNPENLEAGKIYLLDKLAVTGFTYTGEKQEIKTTLTQQIMELYPTDIVVPEFTVSKRNGCYNDKLVVEVTNGDQLYTGEKWQLVCTGKEKPSQKLTCEPDGTKDRYIIKLDGNPGTYNARFVWGIHESEKIEITENRAKISYVTDDKGMITAKLPHQEKTYDGMTSLTIICNVNDGQIFKVESSDGRNYSGMLKLIGTIKSDVNVCENSIKQFEVENVDFVNSNDNNKYDTTDLKGKILNVSMTIKKAEINVTLNNEPVKISYRTDDIRWKDSIKELINSKGENISKKQETSYCKELSKQQQKAVIEDVEKTECTFDKLIFDKQNNNYYIGDNNIKFVFNNNKFQYQRVSEIINSAQMAQTITMTQGKTENNAGRILDAIADPQKKQWINAKENITAVINAGNEYTKYYDNVYFRKRNSLEANSYEISDIKGVSTQIEIAGNKNPGKYYEMIFSDEENLYPTVAALICIIKESDADSSELKTYVEDEDKNVYTVINLFLDETADTIEFEEELKGQNRNGQTDEGEYTGELEIGKTVKAKDSQITFTVNNQGSAIKKVEYGYVSCDHTRESVALSEIPVPEDNKFSDQYIKVKANTYTAPVPKAEGDYIMVVRTINEVGLESVYVSNGFIMDWTRPDVDIDFNEEMPDGSTNKINSVGTSPEENTYKNKQISADITINEPHIDDVKVEVTAVDANKNEIKEAMLTEAEKEAVETKLKSWQEDQKTGKKKHHAVIHFDSEANYTLKITVTDKSKLENEEIIYYFTVDMTRPENGSVTLNGIYHSIDKEEKKKGIIETVKEWLDHTREYLVENVIFKLFSQTEVEVRMTGEDSISPVTISYYIADGQMTREELGKLDESVWTVYPGDGNLKLGLNQKKVVYERVQDSAQNANYFSSDGIITDDAEPKITVTSNSTPNANGFYKGDVVFTVKAEEKAASPQEETAGLQLVSYRIESKGETTKWETVYDAKDQDAAVKEKEFQVRVSAKENNSNDIKLCVTAVDNAGNQSVYSEKLMIDNVKPEITVTFDNNNVINGRYYNRKRTATVRIRERNLDTKDVSLKISSTKNSKVSIGKWTHSANTGTSDDALYECKVSFTEDDDYKFTVSCIDQAGNKAVKNYSTDFTLDTAKPEIAVNYSGQTPEQDAYYNEVLTAAITITEHNFDASKVKIETNAENVGQKGSVSISPFQNNGDVNTATVRYDTDGEYRLAVSYTDEAGNAAEDYTGNQFVVDLIEPELEITNIENQSANAGEVKPVITCRDQNYDSSLVDITLIGANSGEVKLDTVGYEMTQVSEGQQFTLGFPKTEKMDDVYTLKVKVEDKAGNAKEASLEFSVNRYGSVYTLGSETGEWLENGVCSYIPKEKPVVIVETNVNDTVNPELFYSREGVEGELINIHEMKECSEEEKESGCYYEISDTSAGNGWHQKCYEIQSGNFEKEGIYNVLIYSKDAAGNENCNTSSRHRDGELNIRFAVDRTAPSVVFSGVQDGGVYNETEHTVLLDVQDNIALETVTVYLNDKEYGTYTADELGEYEDGIIPIQIKQAMTRQKIQVTARDLAGNTVGSLTAEGKRKDMEEIEVLVTANTFVWFVHTKWLWLLFAVLILCIARGARYIIHQRRKKESVGKDECL